MQMQCEWETEWLDSICPTPPRGESAPARGWSQRTRQRGRQNTQQHESICLRATCLKTPGSLLGQRSGILPSGAVYRVESKVHLRKDTLMLSLLFWLQHPDRT